MSDSNKLIFADRSAGQLVLGSVGSTKGVAAEIQRWTGVQVHARGSEIRLEPVSTVSAVSAISGDSETSPDQAVALVRRLLEQLYALALKGQAIAHADVSRAIEVLKADRHASLESVFCDRVLAKSAQHPGIAPRSLAQKKYLEAIARHPLVFGVGPAGTGKTYLAVASGVRRLLDKDVRRLILTRPAIEAGESLGFLPGTLEEKIGPYMSPLFDALNDMLGKVKAEKWLEDGTIEIAPLAYMRGRTLNEAFVILDEAQNATREQMKMFLTRIGVGTTAVVTGDPSQNDLGPAERSGLVEALQVLRGVSRVSFCRFTETDVMRHPLVQDIVRAYSASARRRAPEGGRILDDRSGDDLAAGRRRERPRGERSPDLSADN